MSEVVVCDWCMEICCTGPEYSVRITQKPRGGRRRFAINVDFCSADHMIKYFAKRYGEDDEIV